MKSSLILTAAAAALLATSMLPAKAGDIQGDAYGCEELWVMRNEVYKSAGYCFKTARAINYFGNGGCSYFSEGAVPLSRGERSMIRGIRASERRQAC